MRFRSLAVTAVALILVGCASPAAPSPSEPVTSPTVAPTRSLRPSPTPAPSKAVVIPHADPDLEARLPDEVDGKTLTKLSVDPSSQDDFPGAKSMIEVAKEIGDGSGDFGLAYAGDPDARFNLFALRVPGADPSKLATEFAQITYAETFGGKVEAAKLNGRNVVHIIDPFSEIGDVWFYVDDPTETLLGVQAKTAAKASALMALIK
jgi:hypothetical protein